jgi:DNA polymerase-4
LTLKAKFADFRLVARSRTLAAPMSDRSIIAETGRTLLRSLLPVEQGIRLLGLTLSGLGSDGSGSDLVQPPFNFDADAAKSPLPRPTAHARSCL